MKEKILLENTLFKSIPVVRDAWSIFFVKVFSAVVDPIIVQGYRYYGSAFTNCGFSEHGSRECTIWHTSCTYTISGKNNIPTSLFGTDFLFARVTTSELGRYLGYPRNDDKSDAVTLLLNNPVVVGGFATSGKRRR